MNCSLLKKRAGRADGASGVGLKKMELGGLARTACHEVPLRPHYVMLGAKLERRKLLFGRGAAKINGAIDAGTLVRFAAQSREVRVSVIMVGDVHATVI